MTQTPLLKAVVPGVRLAAAALALLSLFATPASAQLFVPGVAKPLTGGTIYIGNDICYDRTNNVYFGIVGYLNLMGVFTTPGGDPISAFRVGESIPGSPHWHYPRCGYSPDLNGGAGGFLVIWHQLDGNRSFLHSAVVTYPGGYVAGSERILSDGTDGGSQSLVGAGIAYSEASDRFLVAYNTVFWNIDTRFVSGVTGEPIGVGPTRYVNASPGGGVRDPALAWSSVGDSFGLTWSAWGGSGTWVGFERISAASGTIAAVSTFGFGPSAWTPNIDFNNRSGNFVIGWSTAPGSRSAEVTLDGAVVGAERVISTRVGTATSFDLAYNRISGTFLAISEDTIGFSAAGLELKRDGSPIGIATGLTDGPPAAGTPGSFVPRVAARANAKEWNISFTRNLNLFSNQIIGTNSADGPSLTFLPNRGFPAVAGSKVVWTATVAGAQGTLSYKFERWRPGSGWVLIQDFLANANTASHHLGVGDHKVRVTVRSTDPNEPNIVSESAVYSGVPTSALSLDGNLGAALAVNTAAGVAKPMTMSGTAFAPWGDETLVAGGTVYPGDLNGDGLTDLFAYNPATGAAARAYNTGVGFDVIPMAWGVGFTPVMMDFHGDGLADVFLYSRTTGQWQKCESTGAELQCIVSGVWGTGWSLTPGDFNGDGKGDLFLYNNQPGSLNAGLWVRVLSGATINQFQYIYGSMRWAPDWTVTPADFDGDGRTEIFLYRGDGLWFQVFFTAPTETYIGARWASGWTIRPGEFTGDRRTDLFLYNPTNGQWFVTQSLAGGNFAYYTGRWGAGWTVSVTDHNGDRLSDLTLYNPNTGLAAMVRSVPGAAPGTFVYGYTTLQAGLTLVGSSAIY